MKKLMKLKSFNKHTIIEFLIFLNQTNLFKPKTGGTKRNGDIAVKRVDRAVKHGQWSVNNNLKMVNGRKSLRHSVTQPLNQSPLAAVSSDHVT